MTECFYIDYITRPEGIAKIYTVHSPAVHAACHHPDLKQAQSMQIIQRNAEDIDQIYNVKANMPLKPHLYKHLYTSGSPIAVFNQPIFYPGNVSNHTIAQYPIVSIFLRNGSATKL